MSFVAELSRVQTTAAGTTTILVTFYHELSWSTYMSHKVAVAAVVVLVLVGTRLIWTLKMHTKLENLKSSPPPIKVALKRAV